MSTPHVGSSTPLMNVNVVARNSRQTASSINRTPKSSIPQPGRIMSDNDRSASNNGFNNTTSYKGNLASSRSLFGKGKIKPTFGMTVSNVKTVRVYNNHTDQVDKYQPQKLNNFTNLMMYSNNNRV